MVLEVLEASLEESRALIMQAAAQAKSLETEVILAVMDKEHIKTLLYVLIPIV